MTSSRAPLNLSATADIGDGMPREISAYRLLVDSISLSMWVSDAEGMVLFFNAFALRYMGAESAERLAGLRWVEAIHPEDLDRLVARRNEGIAKGVRYEVDGRLRRGDGSYRWQHFRVEPVRDANGTLVAWIGTALDVEDARRQATERETLLEELAAQQATSDAIREQLPVGLIIVEAPSGRIVYHNSQAERVLGRVFPADEVADYARFQGIHPDGTPYRGDEYPTARALAGETVDQEPMLYRRGGEVVDLSVSAAPVRDTAGRIVNAVCNFVDVTARRAAERSLAEREERLRAALAASRTGTFRWDIRTNALDWDDNLDALFGLEPGRTARSLDQFVALVHPDDRARVIAACQRCAADGVDFDEQFRVVWPDGTVHWVYDKGKTYRDASGQPAYMTGACVDVTESRRQREEAEAARSEAQAANAAKSNFLAMMSHELRTPINAALGYADLLLLGVRGELTADQTRDLERIRRSQRTLLALVNEVLDFARIEAGRIEYRPESLPVEEVLAEVTTTVEPLAAEKELALVAGACPDVRAFADRGKTQQIVLNLLTNAVKFTAPGGRIDLLCDIDSDRVRVLVRDTGRGIPADRLDAIFEPFVQVDQQEDSKARQGVGLGLAIARQLARGMHGDLTVESEIGEGSTFTLVLPRSDE